MDRVRALPGGVGGYIAVGVIMNGRTSRGWTLDFDLYCLIRRDELYVRLST